MGPFPPNSSSSRLTPAARVICSPTAVLPMKAMTPTPGWVTSSSPTSGPP